MRNKVAFSFLIAVVAASAAAQQAVTVTFPTATDRTVWVGSGSSPEPKGALNVKATTAQVPVSAGDTVFALDRATGNLAKTPISKAKSGWSPTAKDFNRIGSVIVQVNFGGKPVAAAQVDLKDATTKQSSFLDPSSGGQLTFSDVAPGSISVTVRYKSKGTDATPVTQVFDAPLNRESPKPTLVVAVPTEVATIESTSAGTPSAVPAERQTTQVQEPQVNWPGKILGYLLGLLLVGGAVFAALKYLKQNQDKVVPQLEKLGVQIPKPQDDQDAVAAVPPPMAKPEPPQKIILDSAPVPAPMPMVAPMPTGEPRLVSEAGDILPLDEGELVVGRDVAAGLSLPSETTLSRRHASLMRSGGTVTLTDLGSTNGTFVNGAKLQGMTTLQPGDMVQFGAVRFRFEG